MREVHALLLAIAAAITSCYHLPEWHGDVVVHPLEREGIKQCGTGELTAEGKRHITRRPYLQSTTMNSTVIAVGTTLDKVEVAISEPNTSVPLQVAPAIYAGHGKRSEGEVKVVAAPFGRLDANHLYCYQITSEGVALTQPAPFTTAPPPGLDKPFRFVVVGDSGTGGDAQQAIAKRMTEVGFDFMIFLGDIAYTHGTPAQLQDRFFRVYEDVLRYVPAFPSIGNHERHTEKGRPYFEAFVLPKPERYYSFDWGDVHFVAIDTTHRDSEQLAWLRRDLAETKQRWKVVFGHHPMYTNSLRGPQRGIRKSFVKIFTDNKVDLVITGHEHQYERFRVGGVNYIVSGGGGGRLTRFFGMSRSLERATVHHFLHVEATRNELTVRAIDIDGVEIEKLRLLKELPNETPKARVDGIPERKESPVAPEQETVPDERLHDEADDDVNKPAVPGAEHLETAPP